MRLSARAMHAFAPLHGLRMTALYMRDNADQNDTRQSACAKTPMAVPS